MAFSTSVVPSNGGGNQFLRKIGLVVGNSSSALDLSQLEIDFMIRNGDFNAPNTAYIRIYNPQASTVSSIQNEYQTVVLQAGYQQGNYGIIFSGIIMQVRTGKLDNVTRYIDIMAADGDLFYSYGIVNQALTANSKQTDVFNAIQNTLSKSSVQTDPNAVKALQPSAQSGALSPSGGVLPRGKVLYGLGKSYMSDLADKANATWFIEDGVLKIIPLTGYSQGTAVEINSQTGMVGVPEATEQGVKVKCLLNPLIKIGNQVKLNQNEITTTKVNQQGFPNYQSTNFFASLSPTGLYVVVVAEHTGGIRKNTWYTDIICLAIDQTSNQVQAYP